MGSKNGRCGFQCELLKTGPFAILRWEKNQKHKEPFQMKHCSECGSRTLKKIPEGDNRERDTCESCGRIFYQSSKIVVVCIPEWQGRILLCRRAIEPRRGHWCLPGGYLETGETLEEGAQREVYEETFASVENLKLFSKAELIHLNLVMFCFQGKMKNASFRAGQECLEVRLFEMSELLEMELAFNAHRFSLEAYAREPDSGGIHSFRIDQD